MSDAVLACHRAHAVALLRTPGVTCVWVGLKNQTGPPAVVVGVREKRPPEAVTRGELIPAALRAPDGAMVLTDVVQTGEIVGPRPLVPRARTDAFRTSAQRPAPAGISLGHPAITAGTLGLWVKKAGALCALTNNHVAAASNDAQLGDPVLQPGPADGGTLAAQLGVLAAFVPIRFPGENGGAKPGKPNLAQGIAELYNRVAEALDCPSRLRASGPRDPQAALAVLALAARALAPDLVTVRWLVAPAEAEADNEADCALVTVHEGLVREEIYEVGRPTELGEPALGMPVQKSGRTTDLTQGVVTGLHAVVQVSYGQKGVARFAGQAVIQQPGFSAGGDSGSAIVTQDGRRFVGLLFAGSAELTLFTPAPTVQRLLGFTL